MPREPTAVARGWARDAQVWRRRPLSSSAPVAVEPRTYPAWLAGASVERRRFDDPDVAGFLRRGIPVVLEGCPLIEAVAGRWSWAHLAEHLGNGPHAVHFAPRQTKTFARYYGTGLGKGGIMGLSFARFVARIAANEALSAPPWRFYLQTPLAWNAEADQSEGASAAKREVGGSLRAAEESLSHVPMSGVLAEDLKRLGWEWLSRACALAGCSGIDVATLWAGHGGGCTPLHYDTRSNFFGQIAGRKRCLLFPPSMSANLYPHRSDHPMDRVSAIDVEAPDLRKCPGLRRARGLEATLSPGDVLFMPSHWSQALIEPTTQPRAR